MCHRVRPTSPQPSLSHRLGRLPGSLGAAQPRPPRPALLTTPPAPAGPGAAEPRGGRGRGAAGPEGAGAAAAGRPAGAGEWGGGPCPVRPPTRPASAETPAGPQCPTTLCVRDAEAPPSPMAPSGPLPAQQRRPGAGPEGRTGPPCRATPVTPAGGQPPSSGSHVSPSHRLRAPHPKPPARGRGVPGLGPPTALPHRRLAPGSRAHTHSAPGQAGVSP